MIGYGLAKSAVHHLVQDLAQPNGGLPQDAKVAGILPYVSFILREKSTHFYYQCYHWYTYEQKVYAKGWFQHMDLAKRYCNVSVIYEKKKETSLV